MTSFKMIHLEEASSKGIGQLSGTPSGTPKKGGNMFFTGEMNRSPPPGGISPSKFGTNKKRKSGLANKYQSEKVMIKGPRKNDPILEDYELNESDNDTVSVGSQSSDDGRGVTLGLGITKLPTVMSVSHEEYS